MKCLTLTALLSYFRIFLIDNNLLVMSFEALNGVENNSYRFLGVKVEELQLKGLSNFVKSRKLYIANCGSYPTLYEYCRLH